MNFFFSVNYFFSVNLIWWMKTTFFRTLLWPFLRLFSARAPRAKKIPAAAGQLENLAIFRVPKTEILTEFNTVWTRFPAKKTGKKWFSGQLVGRNSSRGQDSLYGLRFEENMNSGLWGQKRGFEVCFVPLLGVYKGFRTSSRHYGICGRVKKNPIFRCQAACQVGPHEQRQAISPGTAPGTPKIRFLAILAFFEFTSLKFRKHVFYVENPFTNGQKTGKNDNDGSADGQIWTVPTEFAGIGRRP